ncbi:MAG: DUF1573 domain-containing protein [Bacteroidota bacterium]
MRQVVALASLLLLLSLTFAQPKVTVDRTNVDLGVIYNGATKKARVVVKNSGKDTLKILGVYTSCGCTTVKQPKTTLTAGESDAIEVEFNSTGFRGKITKHITIQTNDPASPQVYIALVADVIDELEPVSRSSVIWLGAIPVGKAVEQPIAFKNVSGKPMTLRGYKSSSEQVVARLDQRSVLPADTIRIFIKVTPKKMDYSSEQILLETDSNKQSQVPIRITFIGVRPD